MGQPETNWLNTEGAGAPKNEAPAPAPKKLGLGMAHVERGRAARAALDRASPDAGPGEAILHELIGQQVAIALAVLDAQGEVAARVGLFLDDPKTMVILAKALRELTTLSNVIGRRVEGALLASSTLRAQRRLWNPHDSGRS